MNRLEGPLDRAVFGQIDALVAVREAKKDVRRVYRNLNAAEGRILAANRELDPAALQTAKSA